MALYVVMICDRHADPSPLLFADRDTAISYARGIAHNSGRQVDEDPGLFTDDNLYSASWGTQGDHVFVVERTVEGQ